MPAKLTGFVFINIHKYSSVILGVSKMANVTLLKMNKIANMLTWHELWQDIFVQINKCS